MDVKNYSEQIMQQIWTQPTKSVKHIEQNIDKEQFIKISSWVLEYYGGTSSHEFLLKFNRMFLSLSLEELRGCIDMMSHSKARGVESLATFYGFYTNINDIDFFGELGIVEAAKPYIGKGYTGDYFHQKKLLYLAISEEDIAALENVRLRKASRLNT